jgi:peptidoglycan hydrolase-like protein with peptidoglycan-binding domain
VFCRTERCFPGYDDSESFNAQPAPVDVALDKSTSLIMSVQKELARLGYYHGPIDGVDGLETERAIRWFQSIDHLPPNRPDRHRDTTSFPHRVVERGSQDSAEFQASRACWRVES